MASLQLNVPVPVSPAKTLAKRIEDLGPDFSQFAVELEPTDTGAEAFPDPRQGHLHIIVQLPPASERSSSLLYLGPQLIMFPSAPHFGLPSGPASTNRNLEINCLVQGDDLRNIFPVKIGSHESVGTFKQAIRKGKEPALDHVPADTLVLWKVSIPAESLVRQDPRILDLDKDHSLLPTNQLSEVFSDALQEEHIHVVVRAPNHGEHEFFVLFCPCLILLNTSHKSFILPHLSVLPSLASRSLHVSQSFSS
jgi:hypothetical protein